MKLSQLSETPSCSVYNQYLDTNLHKLIDALCNSYDSTLHPFLQTFKELADLSVATGSVLDNKGKLLGFNRYITFNDPLNVVKPDTPGISGYKKLMDDYKECRLSDESYRIVLMLISQTRNTVASVETLTQVVSTVTNAEILVDDSMDMRYITYYFLDRIPGWLEVVIENYDVLPRPAGMETKYISSISRFFGFLIQYPQRDPIATSKIFSGFWKARFPLIDFKTPNQQKRELWTQHLFTSPYKLKNISTDDFHEIVKKIDERVQEEYKDLESLSNLNRALQSRADIADVMFKNNYNYSFPKQIDTIARQYSKALEADNFSQGGFWSAQTEALRSYLKHEKVIDTVALPLLHDKYKHDMRSLLYYDKRSGWYYYKEPDSSGRFDVKYIANLYQDDCNLWFPQDPLHIQLRKGRVELRSKDYQDTGETKTLTDSPVLSHYKRAYSSASSDNKGRVEDIIENLHTAAKTFHYCYRLNKVSFRAVIDFEMRILSIFDVLNIYNSKRNYGSEAERDYYSLLYNTYKDYVGAANSYSDRFSDEDSRIYKHRQHLRYMRRKVKECSDELDMLYNKNKGLYNIYSSGLSSDVYYAISQMKTKATQEYFTDFEMGRTSWGYGSEAYSMINLSNEDIRWYISEKQKDIDKYQKKYDAHETAREKCNWAAHQCPDKQVNNKAGLRDAIRWCLNKGDLNGYPSDSETYAPGDWWIDDIDDSYWSEKWRYCDDGGENKATTFASHNVTWRNKWGDLHGKAVQEKDKLQKELATRNKLTDRKSLRTILREYQDYTPNIEYDDLDKRVEAIKRSASLTYTIY